MYKRFRTAEAAETLSRNIASAQTWRTPAEMLDRANKLTCPAAEMKMTDQLMGIGRENAQKRDGVALAAQFLDGYRTRV